MTTTTTSTQPSWDFTPVFDLIHSLKTYDAASLAIQRENKKSPSPGETIIRDHVIESSKQGLGNFDKLWDHLGVQRDLPTPLAVPHFGTPVTQEDVTKKDAYASDGAIYYPASSENVNWRYDDGHDLTDFQPRSPNGESQLNKNQRKKENRKARKEAERLQATQVGRSLTTEMFVLGADSESSPPLKAQDAPKTSKKKTKAKLPAEEPHSEPHFEPSTRQKAKYKYKPSHQNHDETHSSKLVFAAKDVPTPILKADVRTTTSVPSATKESIEEARRKVAAAMHVAPPITPKASKPPTSAVHEGLKKQWPVANPFAASQAQGSSTPVRSSQASTLRPAHTEPPKKQHVQTAMVQTTPSAGPKRHEILPLINQTSVDRNWSLFLKLIHNFPEDRKHLVSPLQLSINRPLPNGIHVFVDASNIMIGFMEHLKRIRGIHRFTRVPHVDLNFHALALLLERRRPVTKRVLAGSTPEIAAFEEARQVGYETCILDKVYKARELTERQKGFEGYTTGDGSDGNAPPQKAKWVEQAVDEILHLKICESVIDTTIAADADSGNTALARPTMVLATGDAAEAEYSPGFLKMVERALKKGWNVEVMAFGKTVSMGYRRMQQLPMDRGGWGERFKIIELDAYSEELFGEAL